MARIELSNVSKNFGMVEVLRDVNLDFQDGEFVVLVGPSGCGKSTLLRMIAGLETISGGELKINGKRMNETAPRHRDIAMVFQSYALYPHMDVARNMGFSLEIQKTPKEVQRKSVARVAKTLGLEALVERLPRALSGGQRQRVAMGRAITRDPQAFLFDEPLSNLDAALRVEMRLEIARLHQRLGSTMVYVTHDQVEAMTLADRIVVLNGNLVQQVGTPLELYERPSNKFVAQFIGSPTMNIFSADCIGLETPEGTVEVGIRPEHLVVTQDGIITARADVIEHLGSDTNIYAEADGLGSLMIRHHGTLHLAHGDQITLGYNPAHLHYFGVEGHALRVSYD